MIAFKFARTAAFLCAAAAAAFLSTGSAKAAVADVKSIEISSTGGFSVSELYAYDALGVDLALSSLGAVATATVNETTGNPNINAAAAIDGSLPAPGTYEPSYIAFGGPNTLTVTLNIPAVIESIKIAGRQDGGFEVGEWFVELKDASGNSLFAVQTDTSMNTGEQHTVAFAVAADVPLPAALPMLGFGLGALGLIGARRRRRA